MACKRAAAPVLFVAACSFFNHGIFAGLFVWRAIVRPDAADASLERSLLVETEFLCRLLGCDAPQVFGLFIGVYRDAVTWLGMGEARAATAMFWYMSFEGVLHVAICVGAALILAGGRTRLFRVAMLAELWLMDIFYTAAFFAAPYYCMRNLGVCFPLDGGSGGEGGEGGAGERTFYAGLHLAGFFMTLAWLQHMSVLVDVLSYGVLALQPSAGAPNAAAAEAAAKKKRGAREEETARPLLFYTSVAALAVFAYFMRESKEVAALARVIQFEM